MNYAEENAIIPAQQHGFRRHRGIDTALANLSKAANRSRDVRKATLATSFDFSAAFDTIDVDIVVQILSTWMDDSALALIKSYLTGNTQRVRWNGVLSEPVLMAFGVRQGSVLGPLIFVLVTAPIPTFCDNDNTTISKYAVDVSPVATNENIQVAVDFARRVCWGRWARDQPG